MRHSVQGSKRNGRILRSVFPCAAKGAFRLRSCRAGCAGCAGPLRSPEVHRAQVERGASIVEFAMILPLFVGLLMGFIDFGLNLNNISSVRQAVREGARDVAVGDPGDTQCTLEPGVDDPMTLDTNESVLMPKTKALLCGIKEAVPGSKLRLRLAYPNGATSGKKGLICAQYQVTSATGFYNALLKDTVTKVQTQMRIERVEEELDAFTESSLAGQNWTWCA